MAICSICLTIPWHSLPFEDERAYPHHLSIEDLENSALRCPLCALILSSLLESIELTVGEEHDGHAVYCLQLAKELLKGNAEDAPSTVICYLRKAGIHQRRMQKIKAWQDGKTHVIDLGATPAASFEDIDFTKFIDSNRITVPAAKSTGDALRPWLYTNRWITQPAAVHNGKAAYSIIGFGVRGTSYPEHHHCAVYETEVTHYRGSSLRVVTDDDDPYASIIPGRLREIRSNSIKAINRVRDWLRTCDVQHQCIPKMQKLPTRVLDLGTDLTSPIIRLLETNGQHGWYIALSHSWGSSGVKFTTTALNIGDRMQRILIEDMPLTFYDVVMLASHLYVRYVWIDSLCIIQGDPHDWEIEAPKMSEVYSHAYLTVSASDATSSADGCIPSRPEAYMPVDIGSQEERNNKRNPSEVVQADLPCSTSSTCTLYFAKEWMRFSSAARPVVYRVGTYGRLMDPILYEHLSSRAWTLQERLLSPRVLHYGRDQMYWECKQCFCAEDGARFDPFTFSLDAVVSSQELSHEQHGLQGKWMALYEGADIASEVGQLGGRWLGWLKVVSNFTRRRLTYLDDRLPALSGLAQFIAAQTKDRYLAGLWKNHIYEDLYWRAKFTEEFEPLQKIWKVHVPFPKMRMPLRAPSWSWASVESEIVFKPLAYNHLTAELIGCHVTPAGKDPFGKVSSGWIVLLAPLLEMFPQTPKNHPGNQFVAPELAVDAKEGTPVEIYLVHGVSIGRAYFDFEVHFPCFALFLDASHALILRNTGKAKREFQRFGVATFVRTQSQREATGAIPFSGQSAQHSGPITDQVPRSYVRVI